ncbi:MAG TPA: YCF48-related protein [Pyrinomonadaceae bacterium]
MKGEGDKTAARRARVLLLCLCLSPFLFAPSHAARAAGWERQKTGTFAWLHAVFFVDERRGWAAGGKGALLSTRDGGATWEAGKRPTEDAVRDVFFQDAETGWLLCERSMFKPMEKEESVSYLLKTSDGGRTWSRVEVTRGADVDLKLAGLRFADREHGWVFGEMGALFASSDGGATWARQRVPTRHVLLGASFFDAGTGWLSGGGLTVLKTTDGGVTWHAGIVYLPATGTAEAQSQQQPDPRVVEPGGGARQEDVSRRSSRRLNAVCFVNQERGWAVGAAGVILATSDGGRNWRPQASGVGDDLWDVKFFDAREGWAVGTGGAMLHTTDGGLTWNDARRVTTHALERLFTVGRRAWAVGFGGTVVALKG